MLYRLILSVDQAPHAGVRALLAGGTAMLVCLAAGRPLIAWLKRLKVSEKTEKTPIEEDALRKRIASKSGTPTMGGLLVLGAVAASCALWADLASLPLALTLACTLALGALGATDDLMKLLGTRGQRGVKVRHKLLFQGIVGLTVGVLLARHGRSVTAEVGLLSVPWVRAGRFATLALACWGAFAVTAMSNATNVTDGLDGLLAGLTAPAAAVLGVGCWAAGTSGAAEMAVFCGALSGACLGFLWHNRHPARVFMGDTGALAVGGGLAAAAVAARLELLLGLAGAVFLIELASSGLQIASIRLLRRRVFPVAPIHHIFERRGDPEARIVRGFYVCGALAALAGLNLIGL